MEEGRWKINSEHRTQSPDNRNSKICVQAFCVKGGMR